MTHVIVGKQMKKMNNIEIFILINVIVFFTGMFAGMMMTLDDRSNYKVQDANPPKPKEYKK